MPVSSVRLRPAAGSGFYRLLSRRPRIGGHLRAGPLLSPALPQDCSAGSLANLRCPTCNTSPALPLPKPSVEAQSKSPLTFRVSAMAHIGATGFLPVPPSVCELVLQSCLTLRNPMDCSPPGSSVHGILQARIREWIAIPFSRGSFRPRDRTRVSCLPHRQAGSLPLAPLEKATYTLRKP